MLSGRIMLMQTPSVYDIYVPHVNFVNSITPIRSRDRGYHCCIAFPCVILCNVEMDFGIN